MGSKKIANHRRSCPCAGEHTKGKETRWKFLALCAIINIRPPESGLLNCCIGRPQKGWRQEETSCFNVHENNGINERADNGG